MKKFTRVKYVDFINNTSDFEVLILGSLGRSTKFITMRTGYTPSQIIYRLRKQDVRRMDYRNGTSELSDRLLSVERKVAGNFLRRKVAAK